jgi:hypothetical protein
MFCVLWYAETGIKLSPARKDSERGVKEIKIKKGGKYSAKMGAGEGVGWWT